MSEHNKSNANPEKAETSRRATVALLAAVALFGAASMLSLTACKQEQGGTEMSAPSGDEIPTGCSPATTPCQ